MSATSALLAGRRAAEARMVDRVLIEALGKPVTAPDGKVTTPRTTVYAGKCEVHGDRPYEENSDVGGVATKPRQRYRLRLPATAARIESGMTATITASRLQPHLVGREFRIAGPDERSLQTAQVVFIDTP